MRPPEPRRLAVVVRSHYVGLALLEGARLVMLRTKRRPPTTGALALLVQRATADYAVDTVVGESIFAGGRPTAKVIAIGDALARLVPDVPHPTRRHLLERIAERFPRVRQHLTRAGRTSRYREPAILAVALALTALDHIS